MGSEAKKYEIDMCSGSILKKMLAFTIPLMFSSILQLLFNAADIVVVGKFAGDNSLAAVGSNTALINLLTNLFVGLSIGANVTAARFYGAKRDEDLSDTVHTSMAISLISGIFLTVVGILGARQMLEWMQTPEEVIDLASLYLRIYFIGMTSNMVYNFGSALLRAVGDTKRPLYYLIAAGIINIILNLIFVIVLKMDVAGVALATIISETVSAVLVVRCLMKETGAIKLILKKLHIDGAKLGMIMRIGLPAGFQGIVFALSNVVIQSSVNIFGIIVVAGNSAAANIEGFVYVAMNSFYQATISFVSQKFGEVKYEIINKIFLRREESVIYLGVQKKFIKPWRGVRFHCVSGAVKSGCNLRRVASVHILQQSRGNCCGNGSTGNNISNIRTVRHNGRYGGRSEGHRLLDNAHDSIPCRRLRT